MSRSTFSVSSALLSLAAGMSAQASVIVWSEASGGNGHAFEFVEAPLIGWDEASLIAQSMSFQGVSGHVATITDGSEQFFVNNINSFDPGFFPEFAIGMWLGGFQADPTGAPDQGWEWITGEQWNFTDWGKGEPNDGFGPESHLAMIVPNSELGIFGWGDYPGDPANWFGISGFLVEYPLPSPGALPLAVLAMVYGRGRRASRDS